MISTVNSNHKSLEGQLDAIGWGLFFVMSGAMLLVPGLPDGSWVAGIGVLLAGLSIARSLLGLPVSVFGVIVAIVLIAAGAGTMIGLVVPWFAMLLVLCGIALVAGDVLRHSAAR